MGEIEIQRGYKKMNRILIYGAGVGGERLYDEMHQNGEPYEVLAFVDKRIGNTVKKESRLFFRKIFVNTSMILFL